MQQYGHQYHRYVDIAPRPFYGWCRPQHLLNTWASPPLQCSHGSRSRRLRQFVYWPTARPFSSQHVKRFSNPVTPATWGTQRRHLCHEV